MKSIFNWVRSYKYYKEEEMIRDELLKMKDTTPLKKATDIMLDLETLSTQNHAVILSIGAVAFNQEEILYEFYVNIDLRSSMDHGRHVSADTFYWWAKQQPDAGKALEYDREEFPTAIRQFVHWVQEVSHVQHVRVWGNGASFDNAIINDSMDYVGIDEDHRWKFWNNRCFRTWLSEFDAVRVQPNVAHNALDDARAQAQTFINFKK